MSEGARTVLLHEGLQGCMGDLAQHNLGMTVQQYKRVPLISWWNGHQGGQRFTLKIFDSDDGAFDSGQREIFVCLICLFLNSKTHRLLPSIFLVLFTIVSFSHNPKD